MSMTIYSPMGMLGYGFPVQSLRNAMSHRPEVIAVDAGSTDPGPYYLGSGTSFTSRRMVKRDLALLLAAARQAKIPLIIGSAGGAGARPNLEWLVEIMDEIAHDDGHAFRRAVIDAEQDPADISSAIRAGRVVDFEVGRDLSEEDVRRSDHLVLQMGMEPLREALEAGADVVVAGRAFDAALHAVVPIMHGYDVALSLHMGKILECGSMVAVPRESDGMIGIIGEDAFTVVPADPDKRSTPHLVAAHTFYEKSDPVDLHVPGGHLLLDRCRFEAVDERTVKVSGSRFEATTPHYLKLEGAGKTGHRSVCIAGVRDPVAISHVDTMIESVRAKITRDLDDLEPERDYRLLFHLYGRDAVMGPMEPAPDPAPNELGILVETIAGDQETAQTVCALARSALLHAHYPDRKANAGNLALRFTPAEFPAPPVYEFTAYHLLEVDDPVAPFTIRYDTVRAPMAEARS